MSPSEKLVESMEKLGVLISIYPDSMLASNWAELLQDYACDLYQRVGDEIFAD